MKFANIVKSGLYIYLTLFCCILHLVTAAQTNPTGTYLIGKGLDPDTEVKGKHGEVRIKVIAPNKIAIAICVIDHPNGDYGDFVDTLSYVNNQAVYINKSDTTCRIFFKFSSSKLRVTQLSKRHPFPCNFGWNASLSGVYLKVSSKIPVIKDLSRGE